MADYALLISVWIHTQDLQVTRLGNVLICRPASKSRWIAFNATGWRATAVPMTVESVRPWWCAANAVHVFSRLQSLLLHRMLDCCANQRYQLVCVFFFFFFPRVTGKSPEEKLDWSSSQPLQTFHSSFFLSSTYSYYSVLSLYLHLSIFCAGRLICSLLCCFCLCFVQ